MVKRLLPFLLLLTITTLLADVNSDVAQCLSGSGASANNKTVCVQNAIAKEGKNQVTTLYSTYTSFAANALKTLNGGGAAPTGNITNTRSTVNYPVRTRAPTPTGPTQMQSAPPPPPPVSQGTPPAQGGIKYY